METREWYNYDMAGGVIGFGMTDQSITATASHQNQPHFIFPNQTWRNVGSKDDVQSEDEDGGSIPPSQPKQKRSRGRPPMSTTISDYDCDYICKICNKSFTALSSLQRHELTHSENNQRFSCEECGQKFTQKPSLVTHMKRQHQGKLDYPCPHCEKKYVRNIELQGHIKSRHQLGPEAKKVTTKCPECEKEVIHLNSHMTVHRRDSESAQHICDICDKTFARKGELTRHLKLHTKEKSLTCPHCPRKFLEEWRVKEHISRTHLVEKKFVSKYCGIKFQYSGSRFRHDQIHETNGICEQKLPQTKIFACEFCPKRVNSELLLKIHMKKTHPEPRLILKKMLVKNISLKENPGSGLFLVRPEKEAKDSGSVCAWHLCLKCGRAFLDLNRARRHNNFCVVVTDDPKSDKIPNSREAAPTLTSENSDDDHRISYRHLDPHLTWNETCSQPIMNEIQTYDDDEGPYDFEGEGFPVKDEETAIIFPPIDHNISISTGPIVRDERKIGDRPDFGQIMMEYEHSDQYQSDLEDEPATTIYQTTTPTPSTSSLSQKQTHFVLPAVLRATTPWQMEHMNVVLTAPKPFQCKTCLTFYASKKGLWAHVKSHAEAEHCCEFCGQRFALRTAWIYHVRTHTGEKPWMSRVCSMQNRS